MAPRRKAGPASADRPPPRATDRDRERRAADFAARRVPVWQVSAVTLLTRLRDRSVPTSSERVALDAALDQVPAEVMRAAELNMRGQWTPAT